MNQRSDDHRYEELKADLRSLRAEIAGLNARLARVSKPRRTYRWKIPLGLLVIAVAAVAQTSDPLVIDPANGVVRIRTLEVGGLNVKQTLDGMQQSLDGLRQELVAVKADQVKTAQQINDRISRIKFTESAQTHLPEFDCGHEAFATTRLTFVTAQETAQAAMLLIAFM